MRLERAASMRRILTMLCVYHTYEPSSNAMSAATMSSGAPRRMRSADPVGPEVRSEGLGNGYRTVRVLKVLEKARDGARKREPRAVECVNKARLSAFRAIPNGRSPRLEVGKGAARRDLQPRAHARRPRFE